MPNSPQSLLGGMTQREFLRAHWQRKPLLVRGALPASFAPLSPEELAGLAMEAEVASRLVLLPRGSRRWDVRYGPFQEEDFAALPETEWTLLVQEVDQWHPAAAGLLDSFRFIPNWRIDDVMVSYAVAGGGVGAHIDNYDVFLVQSAGRRRWRISSRPLTEERLVQDIDVRVLADFEPDEEWILEPGDMLYLPPRIAHEGVALEPCMTFSIGFRAPSAGDMLPSFVHHVADMLEEDERFVDAGRLPADKPGLIEDEALERLHDMIVSPLKDSRHFRSWFGQYVTEPKRSRYPEPIEEPFDPEEILAMLEDGIPLHRTSVAHFAHIVHDDGSISLFVGGQEYPLPDDLTFAAHLLDGPGVLTRAVIGSHAANAGFMHLLTQIVNSGFLIPYSEEND